MCRGAHLRLLVDFLAETFQSVKEWDDIFKVLIGKENYQLRIVYPAKLSCKDER